MKKTPQACHLVEAAPDRTQLWSFSFRGGRPVPAPGREVAPDAKLPPGFTTRGWRQLVSPSVNVGLLPSEEVFIRVVQLPTDDPAEVPSMLEWQIEKLSPVPPAQVVWSYELFPSADANSTTVIVLMAERRAVEKVLGRLEEQGFQADRLVLPQLSRLRAMDFPGDGTWVIPDADTNAASCLVVWYYDGALRHVATVPLDEGGDWADTLPRELRHQAWSAEVEGWLKVDPVFHILTTSDHGDRWALVAEKLGNCRTVSEGLAGADVLAVRIAAEASDGRVANLMLDDVAARYRQRFLDGLWVKAVGAIIVLYLVGVAAYFGAVEYAKYQRDGFVTEMESLGGAYTNALQVKAQIEVLEKQERLKFAALDSWMSVVQALPTELYFRQIRFDSGRTLTISGGAPARSASQVTGYKEALERIFVDERPLFASVREANRAQVRGELSWNFECELAESLEE